MTPGPPDAYQFWHWRARVRYHDCVKSLFVLLVMCVASVPAAIGLPVETRSCEIRLENDWTLQQVRDAVNRMGDMGINCVRVETFYHGTTIYDSAVMDRWGLPTTRPNFQPGTGALSAVIETAHARGMTVYAWVETFYVWNTVLGPGMGPILDKYPEWSIRNRDGTPLPKSSESAFYYISPANLEARRFLSELYAEIANTGVDGLFVDYLRYARGALGPNNPLSFDEASRQRAQSELGLDITSIPLDLKNADFKRWTLWREQQTTDAARALARSVAAANPNVVFCGTVHQNYNPDWRTHDSLRNWPAWWPEVRSWSMQYYTKGDPPSSSDVQSQINAMAVDLNAAHPGATLWPAFMVTDISNGMPILTAARAQPNNGISFWVYSTLLKSHGDLLKAGPFLVPSDPAETMPIRGARNLIRGVLPALAEPERAQAQSALDLLSGLSMQAGAAQMALATALQATGLDPGVRRDVELAYRLLSHAPSSLSAGDADRDGSVTIRDTMSVLQWLRYAGPAISRDASDRDDDGQITLSDASSVLRIAAGL